MAVYVVGDIQGCYKPLIKLLRKVRFDPSRDWLWCVGDLVNRGPDSLSVLRFLMSLGSRCQVVLGNHDLNLLANAAGAPGHAGDAFGPVLRARDSKYLIDWLRSRPLFHRDDDLGWCMVHAGLHPGWSLNKTEKRARKIEAILCGPDWKKFVRQLQSHNFPPSRPQQGGLEKRIFDTAVLTRSRYCTPDGRFNWAIREGKPSSHSDLPWFEIPFAHWRGDLRVVYGHWAARGLVADRNDVLGLDSGCVWGGHLTLARLDSPHDFTLTSVRCPAAVHRAGLVSSLRRLAQAHSLLAPNCADLLA